jgi:hypothetical protein
MGHSMRIYVFGILVAFLGLLAAGQVQADAACYLACVSDISYADGSGVIIN